MLFLRHVVDAVRARKALRNSCPAPFFFCSRRDRFEDPCADEEEIKFHPESGVLAFLETCASALGLTLDREAKACALQTLRAVRLVESGTTSSTTTTGDDATPARKKGTGEAGESVVRSGDGGGGGGGGVGGRGGGGVLKTKDGRRCISSATDVYAAVTDTLSQALVHCERFEV